MTKRQLIDDIVAINHSAQPEFLAQFQDQELTEYLEHLALLRQPRPHADPHSFDRYFEQAQPIPQDSAIQIEPVTTVPAAPGALEYDEYDDDEEIEAAPDTQPVAVAASSPDEEVQTPFAETEEDSESWLF